MTKNLKSYLKVTRTQKENRGLLIKEFIVLIGAIILGQGMIQILPSDGRFLISIGLILFIFGVLIKRK